MRTLRTIAALMLLAVLARPASARGPDEEVAKFLVDMKDPKTQGFAKNQIAEEIGKRAAASKAAVPGLMELLKDPNNAQYAAIGLGAAGPAAKEAVAPMLTILKDPAQTKAYAPIITAIGKIIPPDPKAFVEAITPLLADKDRGSEFARHQAIEVLGVIGPDVKFAAPLLYTVLKDANGNITIPTLKALGRMQPDPKEALPVVLPLLESKDRFIAREAAKAYVRIAPDGDAQAKTICDGLLAAFVDRTPGNRNRRIDARTDIEDLGPRGKFAVAALVEDFDAKNDLDRVAAIRILGTIGPEAREAVPGILKAANNKAKWQAGLGNLIDLLPKAGGTTKDQVSVMIAVLEDYVSPDGMYHPKPKAFPLPFQNDILGRLKAMGPDAADAAPAVVKIIEYHLVNKDGGQSIIVQAMQTLGEMGPAAKDAALPVLLKLKNDFTAQEAVKKITGGAVAVKPKDPPDKPVDPVKPPDKPIDPVKPKDPPTDPVRPVVDAGKAKELMAGLKDPAPAKRKEAILALANAGVAGRVAEPALVEMLLHDSDREMRLLAAYALKKLENAK